MKKAVILLSLLLMNISFAYEPVITQMVQGEEALNVKEIVFISGEPIVFEGTLLYEQNKKGEFETRTYEYDMSSAAGDLMTRELEFTISTEEKSNGQIVTSWVLDEYEEGYTIGEKAYVLSKYNFSRTQIDDVKPVGNYFAGNINIEKIFTGDEEERIKVTGSGDVYGYDTAWAKNETVSMNYTVSNGEWSGTYSTITSDTDQKKVKNVKNSISQISFNDSYVILENNISTIKYSSEMPEFYNGKALEYIVKTSDAYKYESFPIENRLASYNLSGIRGHWGEGEIRKAFALEYMDEWTNGITSPDSGVTRGEFAKIIALVLKLDTNEYVDHQMTFRDVTENNKYYEYIRALNAVGVVSGDSKTKFMPNRIVTRAEAITMIINAIGFENKAPEALPNLKFSDIDEIPTWAIKFIYVANNIGLVKGDTNGNFMPNKQLTKAEIATISNNLVRYLTEEITAEYINFL